MESFVVGYCYNCGAELDTDDIDNQVCANCGYDLNTVEE